LVKTTVDGHDTFYSYDAFGRLIAKKTADDVVVYVYDGGQQTLRFRSTNFNTLNFAAREFYSAGTGELLAADVAASGVTATYWALNDKNGTVRDVVYYSGGSYNTAQIDYTAGDRATVAPLRSSTALITRRSPRGTAQAPNPSLAARRTTPSLGSSPWD
jgi:YD repeat-containing protein